MPANGARPDIRDELRVRGSSHRRGARAALLCRNGPAILIAADGLVAIVITVTGQWTNLSHHLILAIRNQHRQEAEAERRMT